MMNGITSTYILCPILRNIKVLFFLDASKDPIARKLRLRRGRRDHEEADQDQAKILKVFNKIIFYIFIDVNQ